MPRLILEKIFTDTAYIKMEFSIKDKVVASRADN